MAEVAASGLRGRGGGGFPTGQKWTGIRDAGDGRRFAVCNAAEGEPGTFKDRALLRHDPYRVLEGLAIASFAVGAEAAYIATKARYAAEAERLARAIAEVETAALFADLRIQLVLGPDEYLFGEEKALLEVIEGHDPLPRLLPPYEHGLFATDVQTGWQSIEGPTTGTDGRGEANPTLVNNVETLAHVPAIILRGADWFRQAGTAESPGTTVATVVGDVTTPFVGEIELGTPLRALVERAGDVPPGRSVQAVFSGVANAVITADQLDTPASYEGLAAIGTGLGSAGFIVYDDTACMVEVARELSRFLYVESCGQCRSCKFGCGEITRALDGLVGRHRHGARRRGHRRAAALGHRPGALLPGHGGAGAGVQHPAALPGGVRAAPGGPLLGGSSIGARAEAGRGGRRPSRLRRAPPLEAAGLDLPGRLTAPLRRRARPPASDGPANR